MITGPPVGHLHGRRDDGPQHRGGRHRRGRRPRGRAAAGDRARLRGDGHVQRHRPRPRRARARPGARHDRHRLALGLLRHEPHDPPVGAVPRRREQRPADGRARRRPRRGQLRRSSTSTTAPRSPSTSTGVPIALVTRGELVRPDAAPRAARRPRRAGPERARASRRPRSSRSSTTTTSARSRHVCRCARRSTPSARPRRSSSSASGAEGREPRAATAGMLLAAILSDTVILSSPTTTDRDRRVVGYLEELLQLDAREFGMEMFEHSSDVSDLSGEEIVTRDAKEYDVGGRTVSIAQVETVGMTLSERERSCATRWRTPGARRATTSPRSWSPTSSAAGRGCSSPATPRRGSRARRRSRRRCLRPARRHEPQEAGRAADHGRDGLTRPADAISPASPARVDVAHRRRAARPPASSR